MAHHRPGGEGAQRSGLLGWQCGRLRHRHAPGPGVDRQGLPTRAHPEGPIRRERGWHQQQRLAPAPLAPRPLAHRAAWREASEPADAVVPAGVRGAELSTSTRTRPTPPMEKTRRGCRRARTSEHLHPGLGPKHPLLIGSQDQRLFSGHVVRLSRDVPLAIEEENPEKPASGIKQMHRDDADRAGAAERGGGHGWAGERHRRRAPAPQHRARGAERSAVTRVSPCAVRKPGQAGWRDRQRHGPTTHPIDSR